MIRLEFEIHGQKCSSLFETQERAARWMVNYYNECFLHPLEALLVAAKDTDSATSVLQFKKKGSLFKPVKMVTEPGGFVVMDKTEVERMLGVNET